MDTLTAKLNGSLPSGDFDMEQEGSPNDCCCRVKVLDNLRDGGDERAGHEHCSVSRQGRLPSRRCGLYARGTRPAHEMKARMVRFLLGEKRS